METTRKVRGTVPARAMRLYRAAFFAALAAWTPRTAHAIARPLTGNGRLAVR